jgi:anti-sigma regulatory factor (Ser/Thr protein kinase)/predicted ArsR family transcriptional regulator
MDWLLSPATAEAGSALRVEVGGFLRRHAEQSDEVMGAELVVAELIANAVDHAGGPIWVSLDWTRNQPRLTVHDLGPAFEPTLTLPDPTGLRGRGLWLVSQFATDLAIAAKRAGGNRVSVTLPVNRRVEESFDPPPRAMNPLPSADEAGPSGFGREPFLRALVVELSRTVEDTQGPATAERFVAQVGATVGGQMEQEFRAARQIVGRLTPEQLADCYIRLKAAIDGDFYIIEVTDDRVILGNRRCPFGDTVRDSPALCRMTSSVFGGIAARNGGQALVLLEERIAVGDPECRVTVLLQPDPDDRQGHRYLSADPA